jgi:hypothetical protein
MQVRALGLRDKNGIELHQGDEVKVAFWDRRVIVGRVNYDSGNACWLIDKTPIHSIGRDKGTTLEVIEHIDTPGAKPVKSRRKGKPS